MVTTGTFDLDSSSIDKGREEVVMLQQRAEDHDDFLVSWMITRYFVNLYD